MSDRVGGPWEETVARVIKLRGQGYSWCFDFICRGLDGDSFFSRLFQPEMCFSERDASDQLLADDTAGRDDSGVHGNLNNDHIMLVFSINASPDNKNRWQIGSEALSLTVFF